MKKLLLLSAVLLTVLFTGCKKDKGFDYDMNILYGTWLVTGIDNGNGDYDAPPFNTTARFNSDGTYYGKGSFGTGSGTYETSGNTVKCFVQGELYAEYIVVSLTETDCVLKMNIIGKDRHYTLKCRKTSN